MYQNGNFYREKKAFHAGKKIRKNNFAPSEKFSCYAPALLLLKLNFSQKKDRLSYWSNVISGKQDHKTIYATTTPCTIWVLTLIVISLIRRHYLITVFIFLSYFVSVLLQNYRVQLHDKHVMRGNTAVFKCIVPVFVKDYVIVTSWSKASDMLTTGKSNQRYKIAVACNIFFFILRVQKVKKWYDDDFSNAMRLWYQRKRFCWVLIVINYVNVALEDLEVHVWTMYTLTVSI